MTESLSDALQISHQPPDSLLNSSSPDQMNHKVVLLAVFLGLILNWISTYLNIALGFLNVGISVFFVLLIAKIFLGKAQTTRRNLSIVAIAYGGAMTAEASVGLLFLIWLSDNASMFNITEKFPSWLLPSPQVLASRNLFSPEWITPLLVHYFLMFIPGIIGLTLGLYMKNRFINDEKTYPFPSIVERNAIVDVLVTNQKSKVQLFRRFLLWGFVISILTIFYPVLDVSQPQQGWILGISLSTVGVVLFSVGFFIGKPSMTLTLAASSITVYTILSPFIVRSSFIGTIYYDFYSYALQNVYLSFMLGFLLSTILLVPIVWKIGKKLIEKIIPLKQVQNDQSSSNNDSSTVTADKNPPKSATHSKEFINIKNMHFDRQFLLVGGILSTVYFLCVLFVYFSGIIGTSILIIAAVTFYIVIIGSIVLSYAAIVSVAKTSTIATPPFIFDTIPLFIAGARGFTPYIAAPRAEIAESIAMVQNARFAKLTGLSNRVMVKAYLMGYIPAILTTPLFSLLLWRSFGIGTSQLPAPAFPVNAALMAPFAAGDLTVVFNLAEITLGLLLALVFGPTFAIGVAIGLFFPPHMAIPIALGGITRIILERRYGEEKIKDKGITAATALSVGASLTIPLLIIISLFFG